MPDKNLVDPDALLRRVFDELAPEEDEEDDAEVDAAIWRKEIERAEQG